MLAALVPDGSGFLLGSYADDGTPVGPPQHLSANALTGATGLAQLQARHPRWIFDSTAEVYPALSTAGVGVGDVGVDDLDVGGLNVGDLNVGDVSVTVERCHDIALTERILLGRDGVFDAPCRAAAVLARRDSLPAPADPPPAGSTDAQGALFDPNTDRRQAPTKHLEQVLAAFADQQHRLPASADGAAASAAGIAVPLGALRLLIAAESGSALVAAEMTRTGLPWDTTIHERILTDLLGPRPAPGARPPRMAALAEQITAAFGFTVNPDSAVDLRQAFQRAGFDIETTRAWVIRELNHPAVAPVLAYKDLARLYTANGWNWLADWVSGGRLVSEFLPGEVVSGRWATRGGGGLQLPKSVRRAAVAQPGHLLVVADAAQLEPRILAAVSGDPALAAVSSGADLYAALAADGFGGDRAHAKLAMLGAMYGQTTGEAARLMATLRVRYPAAVGYVEAAARRGEAGAVVRSVLGRACPPPSARWRELVGADADAAGERRARQVARDRGRFTRNFVVQASAADWAAVWLTGLRLLLREVPGAELVFFQHDELIVHVPAEHADRVGELTVQAANTARDLVFPGSAVQTPVRPVAVSCYADAK